MDRPDTLEVDVVGMASQQGTVEIDVVGTPSADEMEIVGAVPLRDEPITSQTQVPSGKDGTHVCSIVCRRNIWC